ncbi:helix-turn-helix transcriptional regulator [Streptomyces sp.]|uniref:helix-turn-helix transcriptional regulator n=1 Tax=Streptomyces sp. TaxID=1931 RepID=UPI002F400542
MHAHTPPASDDSGHPTSILVVGGTPADRSGVASILDQEDGFTVLGHGPQTGDLGPLISDERPHVVVVLGDTDPLPTIRALTAGTPVPRVLVVSPARQRARAAELRPRMRGITRIAGITVNLTDMATLVPAIRLLRSGYQVCSHSAADDSPSGAVRTPHAWEHIGKLTGREIEVVHLMLRGWSNAEIAEALTLSGATVKSHVHSLMSKLELRNRIDVITTAYTTGFVRPR